MEANTTQYLTIDGVCARLQMSRASVYRNITLGRLPRGIPVNGRVARWRAADIDRAMTRLEKAAKRCAS